MQMYAKLLWQRMYPKMRLEIGVKNLFFWKNIAAIREDVDGTCVYQQKGDIVDACMSVSTQDIGDSSMCFVSMQMMMAMPVCLSAHRVYCE
jgi:hypothetical protein